MQTSEKCGLLTNTWIVKDTTVNIEVAECQMSRRNPERVIQACVISDDSAEIWSDWLLNLSRQVG